LGDPGAGRPAIRKVGLFVSLHREAAREAAGPLAEALGRAGVRLQTSQDIAEQTGLACEIVSPDAVAEADLVIVLGGDGSLLRVVRHAAPLGVPILGVDMGSFGFLADSDLDALYGKLDHILRGEFAVEERLMLEAAVRRDDAQMGSWIGLNDAVVGVLSYSNLLRFSIWLDGEEVADYSADGLIIATSTGSTAYSLSAGGPVVDPQVESLIITPICPHTLQSRPVVVSPRTVVSVLIRHQGENRSDIVLDLDGQRVMDVRVGDTVTVRQAPCRARLVRVGASTFYSRLRDKLKWGTSH
jgi:NAD+ kinase